MTIAESVDLFEQSLSDCNIYHYHQKPIDGNFVSSGLINHDIFIQANSEMDADLIMEEIGCSLDSSLWGPNWGEGSGDFKSFFQKLSAYVHFGEGTHKSTVLLQDGRSFIVSLNDRCVNGKWK